MNDNKYGLDDAVKTAQFRFGLIAPVINGTYTEPSQTAYYKRVASEPLSLPDGQVSRYSYKTLEKWVSNYNRGGIDALMPVTRSDKGVSRALGDTAVEEIYRLKEAFPRMNATRIYEQLLQGSFITKDVNVCAIQRFIKHNDLKSARNPNMRDRKAFEEASFGIMWQADTCHICYITEDGVSRKVYCIMIVDDHSRLITGGGLFYSDSAYNFQKVLKSAVSAYGIPSKILAGNGAPYANAQLSLICGSIGTALIHTKVRDGASKAKIERNFRTLKERWLYTLDLSQIHSLEKFNQPQLCLVLGLPDTGGKTKMFASIKEQIHSLYKDKRQPLILAIDEAQYLNASILNDLKMLMNYSFDSLNCFTLILSGEQYLNAILRKPVHEALRQRITVHYDFNGLSSEETIAYIYHKINSAAGPQTIIDAPALNAVAGCARGNPRIIDNIMSDAIMLGAQMDRKTIDSEVILAAHANQRLGN